MDLKVAVGNSSEIPAGHQDGSLQLGLYARNYALVPDPLVTLLGTWPRRCGLGVMNWHSPAMTQTLTRLATQALSPTDAAAARREIATTLQQELPLLPIAWYRQSAAVSRGLEGLNSIPRSAAMAWTS